MANPTTKPVSTPTPAPTASTAAPAPVKAPRVKLQEVYPTAAAAETEAKTRTKGPRRAFKTELNGKVVYCVANNEGRAGGVAFMEAGGTVEEIGRAARVKTVSADGVMASINSLPPEEREKVMAQLKALAGQK